MEKGSNDGAGQNFSVELGSDYADDKKSSRKDKKASSKKTVARPVVRSEAKDQKQEPKKQEQSGFADKAEAAEKITPLERLSDDEKSAVAKDYVQQRSQEMQQVNDRASAGDEDLANATLLAELEDRLDEGQAADPELFDEVLQVVAAELGLPPDETDSSELPPSAPEGAEYVPFAEVDDEDAAEAAPPAPPAPPRSPLPPGPPIGGAEGPEDDDPGDSDTPAAAAGSARPIGRAPEAAIVGAAAGSAAGERRHSHLKYVLGGGIVGYLIGRRRGRIKSEKELLPVQHKLEKEVSQLHEQIALREVKIRKLARLAAERPTSLERSATISPEHIIEKRPLPEPRMERIGKLAVLAERPQETSQPATEQSSAALASEKLSAETASVDQLLKVAEHINVENSNVRKYYETGRISQPELRKIIKAYLRGENYQRLITEALRPAAASFGSEHLSADAIGNRVGNRGSSGNSLEPGDSQTHGQSGYQPAAISQPDGQLPPQAASQLAQLLADQNQAKLPRQPSKSLLPVITVIIVLALIVAAWLVS